MRLITIEDFKDLYIKFHQRKLPFLFSKLSLNSYKRTQSAFNDKNLQASNYWIIPSLRARWNKLITGNEDLCYEEYIAQNYFQDSKTIKILALGSGVCSHEIKLAELKPEWEIHCYDFSEQLITKAKEIARQKKLTNIKFYANNILTHIFEHSDYDVVFFHASLHHFAKIDEFLDKIVIKNLKENGYLIINEYVGNNRLQYSPLQIDYINKALQLIPKKYRKIFKTNLYKNKYYGSGILRMIIADPSECADSSSILPSIHKKFKIIEEKPFGNNITQSAFKDIAHHFVDLNDEKKEVLKKIYKLEDEFLMFNPSDFVFGIYQLK